MGAYTTDLNEMRKKAHKHFLQKCFDVYTSCSSIKNRIVFLFCEEAFFQYFAQKIHKIIMTLILLINTNPFLFLICTGYVDIFSQIVVLIMLLPPLNDC